MSFASFRNQSETLNYDDYYDYDDEEKTRQDFRLLIGSCYLSYTLILIILQIILFITFIINKILLNKMPYKIMFHLGIYSLLQQLCHFLSGIYLIFDIRLHTWYNFFIGAINESSYITSVGFVFLLTINRFDVMFEQRIFPSINRKLFFNSFITLCHIFSLILCIFFQLPHFRLFFNPGCFCWRFEKPDSKHYIAFQVQNKTVVTLLTLSLIIYIIIFIKVITMRCIKSSQKQLVLSDIRILLQALFNYVTIVFLEICLLFSDELQWELENGYSFLDLINVIICGNNTVLTYIMSSEIRSKTFGTICGSCKKSKNLNFFKNSSKQESRHIRRCKV